LQSRGGQLLIFFCAHSLQSHKYTIFSCHRRGWQFHLLSLQTITEHNIHSFETRHTASSTSTCWHFAFGTMLS